LQIPSTPRGLIRPVAVLVAASAGLAAGGTARPATAAAPRPTVRVATSYPTVKAGAVNPVTVTVTFPVPISSSAIGLRGAASVHCTPLRLSAAHTAGTSTCWSTAGSPGKASLVATATLTGRGHSATISSAPLHVTVTRRVAPAVSLASYRKTSSCGNSSRYVWLTFDDSGSPAQVRSILGTLRRNNVKATMFPIGTWARAHPSLVSAMRRDGHIIDNHTATHADLASASTSTVLRELDGGARPSSSVRLLRPPGGSGAFSTRLTALAASRGYSLCYWTVDTRDWAGSSTAQMVRKVRYGDELTPPIQAGGVVLMHFHGTHTAAGLQSVIDAVRARRLTLRPLH
jgi:peptidoglycan/xylan/chitin deacetylase (PgdA/CDA1 family)